MKRIGMMTEQEQRQRENLDMWLAVTGFLFIVTLAMLLVELIN